MNTNEQICPDCEGSGIVIGRRIEPRCCMNFNEYGGCCNYPIPDELQEQVQCERCEATGKLKRTMNTNENNGLRPNKEYLPPSTKQEGEEK